MNKLIKSVRLNFQKVMLPLFFGIIMLFAVQSNAVFADTSSSSAAFFNPIDANSLEDLVTNLLNHLYGLVVGLSILMIIFGGILYMISSGDQKLLTWAKNCITFSVIGFAIVVAAPTFLKEIVAVIGLVSAPHAPTEYTNAKSLGTIIANILDLLLSLLGMFCIISLTVAGGMYMTAYGDQKRVDTAKTIAKYSIIGLVVALSSLVVISEVSSLIGGA